MANKYGIAVEIPDDCYFVTEPLVAEHRCETLHAALNLLGRIQMERVVTELSAQALPSPRCSSRPSSSG
jgi:hypothetical protein